MNQEYCPAVCNSVRAYYFEDDRDDDEEGEELHSGLGSDGDEDDLGTSQTAGPQRAQR